MLSDQFGRRPVKPFILITHSELSYERFEGKKSTGKWMASEPLSAEVVEQLRTNPEQFNVPPEPEAA